MNEVMSLDEYRELGQSYIDRLKLMTYPAGVRMIKKGDTIPEGLISPLQIFGSEVCLCTLVTHCRTMGFNFQITGDDLACKAISLYLGFEKLNDMDGLYKAWADYAGHKRDWEAEKASREDDAWLEYGEIESLVLSPLHAAVVEPHLVMIFCPPVILSHLILAATYDGSIIKGNFMGMEASCKEGVIRTYKTKQCQVVSPGMGDRVAGQVQDHEMLFSIPGEKLQFVYDNLLKAGGKLFEPPPFSIPHARSTLGPIKLFGEPAESEVWNALRRRFKEERVD